MRRWIGYGLAFAGYALIGLAVAVFVTDSVEWLPGSSPEFDEGPAARIAGAIYLGLGAGLRWAAWLIGRKAPQG